MKGWAAPILHCQEYGAAVSTQNTVSKSQKRATARLIIVGTEVLKGLVWGIAPKPAPPSHKRADCPVRGGRAARAAHAARPQPRRHSTQLPGACVARPRNLAQRGRSEGEHFPGLCPLGLRACYPRSCRPPKIQSCRGQASLSRSMGVTGLQSVPRAGLPPGGVQGPGWAGKLAAGATSSKVAAASLRLRTWHICRALQSDVEERNESIEADGWSLDALNALFRRADKNR